MLPSHPGAGNYDSNVNALPELKSTSSSSLIMTINSGAKNYHTDLGEIQDIVKRAKSLTLHGKDVSYLTVLDFAGQFLYYTTHQAFMSWRTLYLLVTDISLSLTDAVEEDETRVALSWNKTRTVQEYISYWMNSVHSHAKKQGRESGGLHGAISQYAPVILVATHMDKIPKEQAESKKKWYFETIRRHLSKSELIHHLADEDFTISNLGSDHNIENLKQKIFDLAQKQSYWGEPIPARWLTLEKVLLERKREGIPVLDYSNVESLNQSLQVKIDKAEELLLFLQFEHDLGNVVFFLEKLRHKVVLDPEWLIRGVTTLVTSDEVVKRYPELSAQWYEFKDTGRLTRKLIDSIWSHHKEFRDNKEHLLGVLEQLNIIAKPILKTEDPNEDYYWVPCMVHTTAPENVKTQTETKGVTKTSTLCFESKTTFIHVGVFHRLLATCLSKWMPAKKKEKNLIFAGLCMFELENCHDLLLSLNDFVIQATVTRHTSIELPPDLSLCIKVKEFLHSSLLEISKYLCPNSEYSVSIMCSRSASQADGDRHKIDFLRENKGKEIRCRSHSGTHHSSDELLEYWEKCVVGVGGSGGCGYLTSEQHLNYVAGKLGTEWCSLSVYLGLSSAEIQQIKMNHPCNSHFQIFTALNKWAQRSHKDNREKVRDLVNALIDVERNDLANELESDLLSITQTS